MVYDGFVKGLCEHSLSLEDMKSWEYCGGNANSPYESYFNDFVKKFGHMAHLECEDNCVCGHKIVINCYITNKDFTPTKKMKKIQYQNETRSGRTGFSDELWVNFRSAGRPAGLSRHNQLRCLLKKAGRSWEAPMR